MQNANQPLTDETGMRAAIELAKLAALRGEVPVGAIVVKEGVIIGRGSNAPIEHHDPSAHAEIIAMREAAALLGNYRLVGCTLYVTLEPCVMCAGALVMARVDEIIYAADDFKGGACSLEIPILENLKLNHRVKVRKGPLAEESSALLKDFFRMKRKEKGTSGRKD